MGDPRVEFAVLRAPREIVFGAGQRAVLLDRVPRLGRRVFFVVDPFLASSPAFVELRDGLERAGCDVTTYDGVVPELPLESVAAAVAAAGDAEVFVALGGGSCIDLAKITSTLVTHGGTAADYYGELRVPGPIRPVIALPTTAGTGSEVTPVAVLTDAGRDVKVGVSSPHLIPAIAIGDPELTVSCPPAVTASSGADALAHAIESLTAVRRSPSAELSGERVFVGSSALTDSLAVRAIEQVVAGLERSVQQPDDLAARSSALYGSMLAGLAFGTAGTAAAHAIQYPVGALTHTPHGVGVGVLLPYVMEFNRLAREPELASIAGILGATGEPAERASAAPGLVREFLGRVGIPVDLAQLGFPPDRVDWAAGHAVQAVRLSENNPVPLTEDGARAILRAALAGELALVHA